MPAGDRAGALLQSSGLTGRADGRAGASQRGAREPRSRLRDEEQRKDRVEMLVSGRRSTSRLPGRARISRRRADSIHIVLEERLLTGVSPEAGVHRSSIACFKHEDKPTAPLYARRLLELLEGTGKRPSRAASP